MAKRQQTFQRAARKRKAAQRHKAANRAVAQPSEKEEEHPKPKRAAPKSAKAKEE